jgi:hypothetical protein
MATMSFTEVENSPSVAIVEVPKAPLAVAPLADSSKGLIGDWTDSDVKLPRINLANKSGNLANDFTPGCWVLEKTHALTTLVDKAKGSSLLVTALRMMKQYRENIPFGEEGTQSRVFNSAPEVRANGGTITWSKGENNYSEMAHIEFLVLAPEGLEEEAEALFYNQTNGGKKYARVILTVTGTAYSEVAVILASSLKGHLAKSGLQGGVWELGSKLLKNSQNSWWSPSLKSAGLVDADTAELIATIG